MIILEYVDPTAVVWNLRTGPVRMAPGAQGLGLLPLTAFLQDRGIRSGQRFSGYKVPAHELQLPMKMGYPFWTQRTWEDVDGAWWKAIRPNLFGTLRCTANDGTVRSVAVRTTSDGGFPWDQDPSDVQAVDFDWSLIADDPWWRGPQVIVPFGIPGTATPFYGATGYGPPFYLAAGNSNGSQQITNPGDVDAWPIITINGPVSAFTITNADGSTISGSPALAQGESLVIDTTEDAKAATRYAADGTSTDWTTNLSTYAFRAIPAGSTTAVNVALTGTGGATVAFSPRYFRPFH